MPRSPEPFTVDHDWRSRSATALSQKVTTMPTSHPSVRAEQQDVRERMRALGLGYREIAGEFARRYRLRPRAAWRQTYGWTLKQAADQINAHTGDIGLDPGGIASMTASHLCEYENWPGEGREPTGRKPTPYLLALLASVYGCTAADLLDLADYEHLTPADRLILDTYGHRRPQQPETHQTGNASVTGRVDAPEPQAQPRYQTAARPAPPPPETSVPGRGGIVVPELGPLAAALLSAPEPTDGGPPDRLADQLIQVWKLRQAASYRKLADDLPRVLARARSSEVEQAEDRHTAWLAALTHLYNVASSLAKSFGSFELAGIAADRAVRTAGIIGDPLLGGAAAYRLANVLMSAGQLGPAGAIAVGAADRLRPLMTASRSHTALWGALLATASLATARACCAADAWELLGASKVAADLLATDQADLFSIFGPANWLIHAVNIAAELGNGAEAVRRAERAPAGELPPFLAERRTFLLLGKARGHALCNDADSAAGVLLDAEQAAPEEVRHNPRARSLAFRLLAETPVRSEALRELAARMGDVTASDAAAGASP